VSAPSRREIAMTTVPHQWIVQVCLAFTALVVGGFGLASGQDATIDPEAFEAWKAYGEFARRLQGFETRTVNNPIQGKVRIMKKEYRQNRAGALLRTFPDEGVSEDERVLVQNERYRFEVRAARQHRDQYVLLEYHPNSEPMLPDSSVRDAVIVQFNPHYYFEYQTTWQLFDPAGSFKVRKTARISTPKGERYRLDFDGELTNPPKQFKRMKGFILFDPDRKWCIDRAEYKEEYYMNGVRSSEADVVLSFFTIPHSSGFPLLSKQIKTLTGYHFRRKEKMEMHAEADYQVEVSSDDDESPFLLTAFGMREPIGMTREKRTPRYVWFLTAAVVFIALAVGFRYLARRRVANALATA